MFEVFVGEFSFWSNGINFFMKVGYGNCLLLYGMLFIDEFIFGGWLFDDELYELVLWVKLCLVGVFIIEFFLLVFLCFCFIGLNKVNVFLVSVVFGYI